MKKILSLIFVMILVGAMCVFPVAAAGNGKISMSNAEAKPGDTVQLAVKLTSNPGVASMKIQVTFGTDVLELVDVEDAGLLKGAQLNPDYDHSPYTIAWDATEDTADTGTIAVFTFKIKMDAPNGKTIIGLQCVESCSADETANIISSSSGTITVERILCQNHTFQDMESLDDTNHGRICAVCNYVEKENHSYGQWTITDESHSRICETCGYTQAGNHNWDDGTVVIQANCQKGGQIKYTCKQCENSYIADTAPSGEHTYDHGCDADCNLCGEIRVTEHTFNAKWSSDKTAHWYECSQCKEKKDVAEHIPGEEATEQKAQTCTECGYEIVPALSHEHNTSADWTADESGHWYVCSTCEEKVDYAEHDFVDGCDADCNTCGYVREAVHTYPEGWLTDAESHWRICDSCGEQILLATHVPGVEATADAPQYCTVCGYELASVLNVEKIPPSAFRAVSYGWPWWANAIAIAVILGSIATLIGVPLSKKKD